MTDASFELTTHRGKQGGEVTPESIRAAIVGAAAADGFVVLSRGDDEFVQYDGARLEVGRGGRILRADFDEHAARLLTAFLRGETVAEGAGWRDVTEEAFGRASSATTTTRGIVVVVLLLLGAAAAIWLLVANARG